MKTVLCSTRRFLATFLALALVVLSLPSSALTAKADEVTRYARSETVDEATGDYTYTPSENGDYVQDENGNYVLYTEPSNEPTDPADPENGDGTTNGAPTGDNTDPAADPEATDPVVPDTMQVQSNGFTNTLLGDTPIPNKVKVTYTAADGNITVEAYQKPADGDATLITSGVTDNYTTANALTLNVKFATGYTLKEGAANSYVKVGDAAPIALGALTDAENGDDGSYTYTIFTAADAENSAADDVTIRVASTEAVYDDAATISVQNEVDGISLANWKNGVDEAVVDASGVQDVYYNKAVTFELSYTAAALYDRITGVYSFIGTEEELATLDTEAKLIANENSAALSATNAGAYTIPAATTKTFGAAYEAATEGSEPGLYIVVYAKEPVALSVTTDGSEEDMSTAGLNAYEASEWNNPSNQPANVDALDGKVIWGKDVVLKYELDESCEDVVAAATATVGEAGKTVALTPVVEIDDDYNVTITIKWIDAIDEATAIKVTAKGVGQTYAVSVDTSDPTITAASYTAINAGKVEKGQKFTFILSANDGYEVLDAEGITALTSDIAGATSFTALKALGIYAVQNNATRGNANIFPITIEADDAGLKGTIDKALDGTSTVSGPLTIYLGYTEAKGSKLTTAEEYAVTLEDSTNVAVAKAYAPPADDQTPAALDTVDNVVAVFGEDYTFYITLDGTGASGLEGTPVLTAVSYKVEDKAGENTLASGSFAKISTAGANGYEFTIPAEDVLGNITITATVINQVETNAVTVALNDGVTDSNVTKVEYALFAEDGTTIKAKQQKYTLGAAIKADKTGVKVNSGDVLTLFVTTSSTFALTEDAIKTASDSGVFDITNFEQNGNVYTITGVILENGAVKLAGVAASPVTLYLSDQEAAKTLANSAQYQVGATETDGWKSFSTGSIAKVETGATVNVRFKASSDTDYITMASATIGTTTTEDSSLTGWATDPETGYTSFSITTDAAEDVNSIALTSVLNVGMKSFYVYNADGTNVTRLTVKADSADISDYLTAGTKYQTYVNDYKNNAKSAKIGVVKYPGTENGYYTFSKAKRENTVDTENVVLTFTVAAGYYPTLANGAAGASAMSVTDLNAAKYLNATISDTVPTTKATAYTLTIPKTAIADGNTLTIGAAPVTAGAISLAAARTGYDITASINGVQTDLPITTAPLGAKVTFTAVPTADYTMKSADIKVGTANAKTISVNATTGFTYTTTATADAQVLSVTAVPRAQFGALTATTSGLANPVATPVNGKETTNSTTKQVVTSWTYNNLIPGETYNIPQATIGTAQDVTITSVTGTAVDDTTSFTESSKKAFKIGPKDSGKTFKLTVTWNAGDDSAATYTDIYTVKAGNALTSVKVTGAKTVSATAGTLSQELGTAHTYALTANSGASLDTLEIADNSSAKVYAEITTDAKGNKVLFVAVPEAINGADADEGKITLESNGNTLYTLMVDDADSKVDGSKPNVTLKNATDISLSVNLALPSTVSSNTMKYLIPDAFDGDEGKSTGLVYEVTLANGSTTKTLYYPIDMVWNAKTYASEPQANQTVDIYPFATGLFADLLDEEGAVDTNGQPAKAFDFTISAKVLLVNDGLAAIYGDSYTPAEVLATSDASAEKTVSTKAAKYATSLTARATESKFYAGQLYKETDKNFDTSFGDYVIATVTTDNAATVKSPTDFTITPAAGNEIFNSENFEFNATQDRPTALIYDGKLIVSLDALNTAIAGKDLRAASVTDTLTITAKAEGDHSTVVSTDLKLTIEQRAVDGLWEVTPANSLTLAKKNQTALNTTLGISYTSTNTKAALNKWVFEKSATSGDYENIDPSCVTVTTAGKVTVSKDFTFDKDHLDDTSFKVHVYSDYNPDIEDDIEITLVPAEAAQEQGELILGTVTSGTIENGTVTIVARKGNLKVTPAALAASQNVTAFLLVPNAPIATNGTVQQVSTKYLVTDTNLAITSSNVKVATVGANVELVSDPLAKTAKVESTETAVGSVTITAVPENTQVKKTLALSVSAASLINTATVKEFFTIGSEDANVTLVSPTTNFATNYMSDPTKTRTADLYFESDENEITLKVYKNTYYPITGGYDVTPAALTDYYAQSQLKASTGVTLKTTSYNADGEYKIALYGATGKVTINGVTYTLHNGAKSDVKAGTFTQVGKVFGAYAYDAQVVGFTASNTKWTDGVPTQVVLTADPDAKETDTAKLTTVAGDLAEGITLTAADGDLTSSNGKYTFLLALDTTSTAKILDARASYTFYATYYNSYGIPVSSPAKVTLKTDAAPTVNIKTAYTVNVGTDTAVTILNSAGKVDPTIEVKSIQNLSVNGRDNQFATIMEAVDGSDKYKLTLDTNNDEILALAADKNNLSGYVTYTTDGGVSTKTTKITLTINASASVVAGALKAAITDAGLDRAWSAQNVTEATSLAKLKALINIPSGFTLKWTNFGYDKAKLAAGAAAAVTGTIVVSKGTDVDSTTLEDLTLTIPVRTVSLADGSANSDAIDKITYTLKDGVQAAVTPAAAGVGAGDINVLNGAILTITKVTADEASGFHPDTYLYAGYGVSKEAKSGSIAFGQITAGGTITITPENTVTVTKAANVKSVQLTDGNDVEIKLVSNKANIPAGTTIKVKATNALGYDLFAKVTYDNWATGKAVKDSSITLDRGTVDGTETTAAFEEKSNVFTAVKTQRTFAVTATAHTYTLTVDDQTNGVFGNVVSYKSGTFSSTGASIPVDYGKTATITLTVAKAIDAKTPAAYVVTWTQGNVATKITTARAGSTVNITTKAMDGTNTTLTLTAVVNASVAFNNADLTGNKAITNAKLVGYKEAAYQTVVSTTALTGKVTAPVVAPADDSTYYRIEYSVKGGYEDFVSDDVTAPETGDPSDANETPGIIKIDKLDEYAAKVYSAITGKSTEIGRYDASAVYGDAKTTVTEAINSVSYVYYNAKGQEFDGTETITVSTDPEETAKLTYPNGYKVKLTVVTEPGYDLSVVTYRSTATGVAATGSATVVKPVAASQTAEQTFVYTATIADGIARIDLKPVAQKRTLKVNNPLGRTIVTSITYDGTGAEKFTNGNTAGTTNVVTYVGATATVRYKTLYGFSEVILEKSGTVGEEPDNKGELESESSTAGTTYYSELDVKADSDGATYNIVIGSAGD